MVSPIVTDLLSQIKQNSPKPRVVLPKWEELSTVLLLTVKHCRSCGREYESPGHLPFRHQTNPLLGEHFLPLQRFNPNLESSIPKQLHTIYEQIPVCHNCFMKDPASPQKEFSFEYHREN